MRAWLQLSGGLGLFLLGMVVMTEGLRALAGDALNRALFRFTKSPLSGALSGAFATALVQSSSATTVATVGFVSAGLLTFPQALGVMFGANIGTTITGWLVALVGFKLSLGAAMLPLLFLGMLLRLFGSGWVRRAGWALAGFALIFVGIEQMRAGMAPFEGQLSPAVLPADSLGGRLVLVGLGAAITIITQSSSAGVAIALTALNAGAIGFPQAAALVIGMDAGTTSTTALATLGGSPQTKRTGWSHVIYNLLTAVGALAFLPLYVIAADAWFASATVQNPELALVGFHSTFNILGVLLVLPFTRRFGAMMVRLIPDRGPALTRRLDLTLLEDVGAATPALWSTVRELSQRVFELLCRCLREPPGPRSSRELHQELGLAIAETRRYADQIPRAVERRRTRPAPDESRPPERYRVAALHCLDHLDRLLDRCLQNERVDTLHRDARLRELAAQLADAVQDASSRLAAGAPLDACEPEMQRAHDLLRSERHPYRVATLEQVGTQFHLEGAIERLDAVRWLHRAAYHAWRIAFHLRQAEAGPAENPGSSGRDSAPARSL